VKHNHGRFIVQLSCVDETVEFPITATINGVDVFDGDVVDLRVRSEDFTGSQGKRSKSGKRVKINGTASQLALIASCQDEATPPNIATVTIPADFPDKSEKSKNSEKSDKSNKSDKSGKSGKSDKSE